MSFVLFCNCRDKEDFIFFFEGLILLECIDYILIGEGIWVYYVYGGNLGEYLIFLGDFKIFFLMEDKEGSVLVSYRIV